MADLTGRVTNIEKFIAETTGAARDLHFSDGTILPLTESQFRQMLKSAQDGQPNDAAQWTLDKFNKGIYDESGIVHLLDMEAMKHDPVRMAELWRE